MRTIFIIVLAFTTALAAKGQNTAFGHPVLNDSNSLTKKWSVSMYTGITAGMSFYNKNNASFLAPSIGLQLNRRLNNNLYAFTALSTGPGLLYPNGSFYNGGFANTNFMTTPRFNTNQWGMQTSLQAGLMYVNDARTFSISGSIGVSHTNYPFYPAPQKQPVFTGTRQ